MQRLNSAATFAIIAAVIVSLIGSLPNTLRYQIRDNGMVKVPYVCLANTSSYAHYYTADQQVRAYTLSQPSWWTCSWERFSFWTAGFLLKLIPCVLLTIFMTLLVRMLVEARDRRSRLSGGGSTTGSGSTGGKSQAERTTAMLTIIVAVFLITELPQGLLVLWIGMKPEAGFAMHHLGNIIDLLSLLNSSVNFILYSTMSNLFREEFLSTFGSCCPKILCQWRSQRRRLKGLATGVAIGNGVDGNATAKEPLMRSASQPLHRQHSASFKKRDVLQENGVNHD